MTKSNWSGLATMCSRTQYLQIRERDEFGRPGVYVLVGDSLDGVERQRIYVGQADNARERLDNHSKNKDFWTELILFTSRDEYFNRTHVQYLESKLIYLANTSKRYEMENGNAPRVPALAPADQADAEAFLEDMLVIYPLLGIDAFVVPQPIDTFSAAKPVGVKITAGTEATSVISKGSSGILAPADALSLDSNGTDARGQDTSQGFRVFANSRGRQEVVQKVPDSVRTVRQKLVRDGVLAARDGALYLTRDHVFSSPSQAAAVMLGRSANGRIEWHDAAGRTLKVIQEEQLAASMGHELRIEE